ncbi:hypothetical protein MMC12_006821, partial [Toensbergia leucococca]|nr:hypothetical protein [Toensbergia leucococca]
MTVREVLINWVPPAFITEVNRLIRQRNEAQAFKEDSAAFRAAYAKLNDAVKACKTNKPENPEQISLLILDELKCFRRTNEHLIDTIRYA